MIVIDASALVAIARREPEQQAFIDFLEGSDEACLSSINYVETGIVLMRSGLIASQADLDAWLASLDVAVSDMEVGTGALEAYLRFGKGSHPARLNLADCFAYALAKALDAPLLYKGDDFAKTDIRSAL